MPLRQRGDMTTSNSRRFHQLARKNAPMERYRSDLMYRDIAFVYKATMVKTPMGEGTETWATVPLAISCSFQEHALDTEHIDPQLPGSRYARVFTRHKDSVLWHDKIVVRGTAFLATKITDHFDNITGDYNHTSIRCVYLDDTKRATPIVPPVP